MNWKERLDELGAVVAGTAYESKASVVKHNAAADEIRALVKDVGCSSASDLDEMLSLLSDESLQGWIAYGVLDQCSPSKVQRDRCIDVIREIAKGDGPEALAAEWWLRDNDAIS
jgi:hypothetical protein